MKQITTLDTLLIISIIIGFSIFLYIMYRIFSNKTNTVDNIKSTRISDFRNGYESAETVLAEGHDPKELIDQAHDNDAWDRGWIAACNNKLISQNQEPVDTTHRY